MNSSVILRSISEKTFIDAFLSTDFKKHVDGIELLQKALPTNGKEIIELLDLLLRWFVLRFCESNTTCLLKVLEFLLELFNMLKDEGYSFTEPEAAIFLPCLIEKFDTAVLQYQNQKLFQQLEVEKTEYAESENKLRVLNDKKEVRDDKLTVVKNSFNKLRAMIWSHVLFAQKIPLAKQSLKNSPCLLVTASSVKLVSSTTRDLRTEWKASSGFSVNVANLPPLMWLRYRTYYVPLEMVNLFNFLLNVSTGELADRKEGFSRDPANHSSYFFF